MRWYWNMHLIKTSKVAPNNGAVKSARCFHEVSAMRILQRACPTRFRFSIKSAIVFSENDFRKSFSPKSACLAATENEIFRKFTSCWPKFTPLTRKWFYTLIFTSNHFRVTQNTERARERTHPLTQPTSERKNQTSDPATESFDPANEWEKEPTAPIQPPTSIYLTPITPSSARRSSRQML